MNVSLLRPIPGNECFGLGPFFRIEPLWMEYIARALTERSHDVDIADLRFTRPVEHYLEHHRPGVVNPNRKIFEARKRETAALGAGEKLVLGHPTIAARCMQNLEKVLFTGPKTSDTVTFICD